MPKKHKYTYYRAKREMYDYFTAQLAPKNALFTEREFNKRFPHLFPSDFEKCKLTTDDFYWNFGFRFVYANDRGI